jgi:N-acetylneuraminic acid mutarotase
VTDCSNHHCQRGFALNLETKTWRAISVDGAPPARVYPFAIWTGDEMVVWGGMTSSFSSGLTDGGAYNPKTDTWRTISSNGAPSPRKWIAPIWTGKEVIFWGGADFSTTADKVPVLGDGAAYNPVTDTWRSISTKNAPSARAMHSAVWTGTEMLVWGGSASGDGSYST